MFLLKDDEDRRFFFLRCLNLLYIGSSLYILFKVNELRKRIFKYIIKNIYINSKIIKKCDLWRLNREMEGVNVEVLVFIFFGERRY